MWGGPKLQEASKRRQVVLSGTSSKYGTGSLISGTVGYRFQLVPAAEAPESCGKNGSSPFPGS